MLLLRNTENQLYCRGIFHSITFPSIDPFLEYVKSSEYTAEFDYDDWIFDDIRRTRLDDRVIKKKKNKSPISKAVNCATVILIAKRL